MGDLLGPVLVDDVVVGHGERVRVDEVDLVLPRPGLAFRALHGDPGAMHAVADLADQRLVVRGRQDVVVEDVRRRGREEAVLLRVCVLVALTEDVELELGAEHRLEAELPRTLDLALEHLPGRGRRRGSVVVLEVAEDERRAVEPREPAQRRHVGACTQVAVAGVPVGEGVPGHRIHLHVEGEQVGAALDPMGRDVVLDEVRAVDALADQTPLHVGEGHDHGVDRVVSHRGLELVEGQHPRDLRRSRSAARTRRAPSGYPVRAAGTPTNVRGFSGDA